MACERPMGPRQSFELVHRKGDGEYERPFSEGLFGLGDQEALKTALQKMRLLESIGWPEAKRELKNSEGKRLIARADGKDPDIWILKCKPSCWRLYFHVYPSGKIAYLYPVCKKEWAQDPADAKYARKLLTRGAAGGLLAEFRYWDDQGVQLPRIRPVLGQ